ncbi:MAG: glycosyltransferase [Gemmatimonadetes bacterium]|nr:glycosyltransferase [Gemmatimonadota bacterium]
MSPSPAPLVTVLMVCYNGTPYLRQALDSVRAQTFMDWELVFFDNGSTDESAAIATGLDPRIRVVGSSTRVPLGLARSQAVAASRGRYVAFLDSDDQWRPDKLERQVRTLSAGQAQLAYSDCYVVSGRGRVLGRYSQRAMPADGYVLATLLDENFIPLVTVMVDRDLITKAGGFDPHLQVAADYDLWLRIASRAAIDYDPEPLASYRTHSRNLSSDFRTAYRENLRIYRSWRRTGTAETQGRARRAAAALHWKWALKELLIGRRAGRAASRFRLGWARAGGRLRALRALFWLILRQLRGVDLRYFMLRERFTGRTLGDSAGRPSAESIRRAGASS